MRSSIGSVLKEKGTTVHTVSPSATVCDAVRTMADLGVGSVVVYEAPAVLGLLTERDVLLRVVREARHPRQTAVAEVMETDPVVVTPDTTVGEAMALMTEHRTRHLPVMDGGQLVGLVSIGDLTRWVTEGLHAEVVRLEQYITGTYA